MFLSALAAIWGCVPELASDCQDMTNASSTYFSVLVGAIIGAVISWWIYNRQKKTTELQDALLERIKLLNERHDQMLKSIQKIEENHQSALEAILAIQKRLEKLMK